MFASTTRKVVNFLKREDGPTAVEYAVMLALMIVVSVVVIATIGNTTNTMFGNIALQQAVKTGT
jgi:pilus assembly protein Flp/PilA